MGFYVTTENPNVMIREDHNTQSFEYIIICQNGLYISSTTPQEILHMLKDKYKINIYLHDKYPHDPGGQYIYKYQVKEYLENLYENMKILFNDNLPTDLHTAFKIIKLLIEKGNLNMIHNKDSYQYFNFYQGKENWINYIMRCNSWTIKSDFTYLHYIHQISFYIQETSYNKMRSKYCIIGSINQDKQ